MVKYCTKCGTQIIEGAAFCSFCGAKTNQVIDTSNQTNQSHTPVQQQTNTPSAQQTTMPPPVQQFVQTASSGIWYQNQYKMRKKVLTIWNKYWIEDGNGKILGFTKQKMFKLKEDIRIYTDENMQQELFSIKQEQIFDAWGNFGVYDLNNQRLGYIKRNFLHSAFAKDTWEVYNNQNQQIGKISETSTGQALARKYITNLIPEHMTFELNGQKVATVNQEFKIIGDIWNVTCHAVPPDFDRRVLLGTCLLMSMIERSRK